MNEQERRIKAQEAFQVVSQAIAQNFGMVVDATLQLESISDTYATSRAILILKPMPNWQPPELKDK